MRCCREMLPELDDRYSLSEGNVKSGSTLAVVGSS